MNMYDSEEEYMAGGDIGVTLMFEMIQDFE